MQAGADPSAAGDKKPFASTGPHGHRGRMRTRLLAGGADALADYEILEMLLFLGIPRRDTKPLAKAAINQIGDLGGVLAAPASVLRDLPGFTPQSARVIRLVEVAAARLERAELRQQPILNNWDRLDAYLQANPPPETLRSDGLRVLYLDNRNRLLGDERQAEAEDVAEVVRRALALHATALLLLREARGVPRAAEADVARTARLRAAAAVLSIAVHDHLVLGEGGSVSLRRLGLI